MYRVSISHGIDFVKFHEVEFDPKAPLSNATNRSIVGTEGSLTWKLLLKRYAYGKTLALGLEIFRKFTKWA